MALARWKDLCVDALDVDAQARFWSTATGLPVGGSSGHVLLDGPTPAHRVWVNEVDRAHVVKNRVHLDVDCEEGVGIERLLALGARVLVAAAETGWPWSILADPEGNEFCAFERPAADVPAYRLHGIVVDSIDPLAQATWWGSVLGTEPVVHEEHGFASLERVAVDRRMTLDFVPVPEPRTVPNRVHWDVTALDAGSLDALLAAGATRLWTNEGSWEVLADPEGNEFCLAPAG